MFKMLRAKRLHGCLGVSEGTWEWTWEGNSAACASVRSERTQIKQKLHGFTTPLEAQEGTQTLTEPTTAFHLSAACGTQTRVMPASAFHLENRWDLGACASLRIDPGISGCDTANLRTKILYFRGFDSSRILI